MKVYYNLLGFLMSLIGDAAWASPVSLSPKDFPNLPKQVRKKLDEKKCTIPQTKKGKPHNVIRGEFARPGQKDWAAFCQIDGQWKILFVWGGRMKCEDEILGNAPQGAGLLGPGIEIMPKDLRKWSDDEYFVPEEKSQKNLIHQVRNGGEKVFSCKDGKWSYWLLREKWEVD